MKLRTADSHGYLSRSGCTTLDDLQYEGSDADIEWQKELTKAWKDSTWHCSAPKPTAQVFTDDLFKLNKYHRCLRKPKKKKKVKGEKGQFIELNGYAIRHYAGDVTYNADVINQECNATELILSVSSVVQNRISPTSSAVIIDDGILAKVERSTKRPFLSTGSVLLKFTDQLNSLTKTLALTQTFFCPSCEAQSKQGPQVFSGRLCSAPASTWWSG